jgi:hypothetical protein
MKAGRLFILVEGNDDQRFFSRVIRPLFLHEYTSVELISYASMKSAKVCRYIKGLTAMHYDFIVVADIDQEPTVHHKKKVLMARFCNLHPDRVMVIVKEIESWYLAGLDDHASAVIGVRRLEYTDFLTKELFNRWIPRQYNSRIAFMIECLQYFSIPVAMEKNKSFHYFMRHYHLAEGKGQVSLPATERTRSPDESRGLLQTGETEK